MIWVIAGVLVTVAPLIVWCMTVRTHRVGWAIGALLVLLGAAKLGLSNRLVEVERGRSDLIVLALLLPVLVVPAGWLLERRLAGPRTVVDPLEDRRGAGIAGLVGYALAACAVSVFMYTSGDKAGIPSTAQLLPLPAGLTVVDRSSGGCGSDSCSSGITVTGDPGLTQNQIVQRLGQYLERQHGWHLNSKGQDCRSAGWVIDRTQLCVWVGSTPGSGHAFVEIEDGRH